MLYIITDAITKLTVALCFKKYKLNEKTNDRPAACHLHYEKNPVKNSASTVPGGTFIHQNS